MHMKKSLAIFTFIIVLVLASCTVPRTPPTPVPTETPEPTETPVPQPTPTAPPSAALVNGLYVTLEDLDIKIRQLRDGYSQTGADIPGDSELREEALEDLIDETLFLSAAIKAGIAPGSGDLDRETEKLCESLGSCDVLREWQSRNYYSEESFRRALERETAAAAMRPLIFEKLRETEQLHVYRIWSARRSDLDDVINRLNMGISFTELAKNYDAVTGGDMNWFPRGVLFSQDLEDKIFVLNPGEHTEILEIDKVFNIFYVAEKQTGRAMDTQVEQIAQRKALSDWLAEQKSRAEIEML